MLATMLRLIRSVRVAVSDHDEPAEVLAAACETVASAPGVDAVWAIVFEEERRGEGVYRQIETSYTTVESDAFTEMQNQIAAGRECRCIGETLASDEPVVIRAGEDCGVCAYIAMMQKTSDAIVVRLENNGVVFGVFSIWRPKGHSIEEEAPVFVGELAAEIASRLVQTAVEKERSTLTRALERQRNEFRDLYRHAPVGILRTTIDGRVLHANRAALDTLGYDDILDFRASVEAIASKVYVRPADRERLIQRLTATGTVRNFEFPARRKDGTEIWLTLTGRLLDGPEELQPVIVSFVQDITEQHEVRRSLTESEQRLALAVNAAEVGIWDWEMNRDLISVNDVWSQMLGYDDTGHGTIEYEDFEALVHPEDLSPMRERVAAYTAGETESYTAEFRLRRRDGGWMWIVATGQITERSDDLDGLRLIGTHIDVTERHEYETATWDRLRERETLLREIHHRVKNNLSVIISLLDLQGSRIGNYDEAKRAFDGSAARIRAIALVHELLYESVEIEVVPLAPLVERLVGGLRYTLPRGSSPDISVDCEPITVNLDAAVPLGLALQELLTAIFEIGEGGDTTADRFSLAVTVTGADEGAVEMRITHSGKITEALGDSFSGRPLVEALIGQLDGSVACDAVDGSRSHWTIVLPPSVTKTGGVVHHASQCD